MIRPGSSLSKQKKKPAGPLGAGGMGAGVGGPTKKTGEVGKPQLAEFLEKCDFVGAITILDFEKKAREERPGGTNMWLAYAAFHNGDYRL